VKSVDIASRWDGCRQNLYRPAEVAKILGCSEWWVKEQARKRRIPYSWIGGTYRFTDDHVSQIIRVFEVQPVTTPNAEKTSPAPRRSAPRSGEVVTVLTARTPRRALNARRDSSAA